MYNKIIVSGLSIFFVLALAGVSIADVGTEAGNWEYNPNAVETKADIAAKDHQYNQDALAVIGTEAGNWKYNPNAAETKADIAAKSHHYDEESLARIGTEAGNWDYQNNIYSHSHNEAVADDGKAKDAVCKGC